MVIVLLKVVTLVMLADKARVIIAVLDCPAMSWALAWSQITLM
jgi:hypothetical protein